MKARHKIVLNSSRKVKACMRNHVDMFRFRSYWSDFD